jgi:hypothetical protein
LHVQTGRDTRTRTHQGRRRQLHGAEVGGDRFDSRLVDQLGGGRAEYLAEQGQEA